MILFSIGVGGSGSVAITSAISTHPQMIGAASGLYGFMQMANSALCTLAVGRLLTGQPRLICRERPSPRYPARPIFLPTHHPDAVRRGCLTG
jgi:hypothetical protein